MSLKPLQPGANPLGQYDGYDSEVLLLKGGEIVTFMTVSKTGTDKAAADAFDGYVWSEKRTVLTSSLTSGARPLMLADEGTTGYGTLFGSVVGGTVGQVLSGTALGPHTATGSGKVTAWDKPGLYAVSLDACDTTAATGLQPTNTTLTAGAALYATAAGLLTPNSALSFEPGVVVGRFVEFTSNGSMVTTPSRLTQALNSPSGSSAPTQSFSYAVFHFNP